MYGSFAHIYDLLMKDVDYEKWAYYYGRIFERFSLSPKLICDLGCGTGTLTIELAKQGYDMTGIDISENMLSIASNKAKEAGADILFLNQNMTEFELYGTMDAIVSSLDCVNHITAPERLEHMFSLVHCYLNPGGLFIFDINSEHKLKNILGNNTFVSDDGNIFYVWENSYDENERICDFYLTFFVKHGALYERIDASYSERAYSVSELLALAGQAGLKVLGVYDEFSFDGPKNISERIFFVLRREDKVCG